MKLMLLGCPGVGKGTQAQFICQKFNIPQISTGDMMRAEIKAATPLGVEMKSLIEEGQLVPDDIICQVLLNRISDPDCANGFLLDGFPRTVPQADALVANHIALDAVIVIDAPQDEVVRRLSGRRVHLASGRTYHIDYNPPKVADSDDETGEPLIQREDDQKEVIMKRLSVYHELTHPLIEYYEAMSQKGEVSLVRVDGIGSVDDVKTRILSAL